MTIALNEASAVDTNTDSSPFKVAPLVMTTPNGSWPTKNAAGRIRKPINPPMAIPTKPMRGVDNIEEDASRTKGTESIPDAEIVAAGGL